MLRRTPTPGRLAGVTLLTVFAALLSAPPTAAQMTKADVAAFLDARAQEFGDIAQKIWDLAEVGYQET